MCRNIRQLHNFEPPATSREVHEAALQYVRKIAGTTKPSKANEEAFNAAVHEIAHATAAPARAPQHHGAAEEPRGRGAQGPGPSGQAVRDRLSVSGPGCGARRRAPCRPVEPTSDRRARSGSAGPAAAVAVTALSESAALPEVTGSP